MKSFVIKNKMLLAEKIYMSKKSAFLFIMMVLFNKEGIVFVFSKLGTAMC